MSAKPELLLVGLALAAGIVEARFYTGSIWSSTVACWVQILLYKRAGAEAGAAGVPSCQVRSHVSSGGTVVAAALSPAQAARVQAFAREAEVMRHGALNGREVAPLAEPRWLSSENVRAVAAPRHRAIGQAQPPAICGNISPTKVT